MKTHRFIPSVISRSVGALVAALMTIVVGVTVMSSRAATVPDLMSFQGFLSDANGLALGTPNPAAYPVVFRIYSSPAGGAALWAEQQTVTVDKGNFSVILGQGSAYLDEPHGALSGVVDQVRYVGTWVSVSGTYTEILPRLRLLPTPYAFLASKVTSVDDVALSPNVALRNTANTFTGDQTFNRKVGIGATPMARLDVWGGSQGRFAVWDFAGDGESQMVGSFFGHGTSGPQLRYERSGAPGWWDVGMKGGDFVVEADDAPRVTVKPTGNVGIGTGNPVEKLHVAGGARVEGMLIASSLMVNGAMVNGGGGGGIPIGGIIMWSGALNTIPAGWALCDGNNNTPNLRDRFIMGAGSVTPGTSGGANSVTLNTSHLPAHTHGYEDDFFVENRNQSAVLPNGAQTRSYSGGVGSSSTDNDNDMHFYFYKQTASAGSASPAPIDLRPSFFALAFIMRVQ